MTSVHAYVVTAARGTCGHWVFQCADFPRAVARGRTLDAAYTLMPAQIAAVAGVTPSAVDIDIVPTCTVVALDDAQASLPALIAESAGHEIYLTRNHEAVAVLIGSDTYERLLDHLEELENEVARVIPRGRARLHG